MRGIFDTIMHIAKRSFIILIVLTVWTIGSLTDSINSYLMPAPWKVFFTASDMILTGDLFKNIQVSMCRVFIGFGITFSIAFPLAILVGLHKTVYEIFETPLEFIRHIPPLATTPILILWFGIGETPKLVIIILATFFPIFLNTVSGVVNCDQKLIEVGEMSGFGTFDKTIRIILPAALPAIIVGMRLGLGYSWRALIGAELLAAAAGLGYMIIEAEELARPDMVLVGIIVIGSLGHLLDTMFFRLSSLVIPWQGTKVNHARG